MRNFDNQVQNGTKIYIKSKLLSFLFKLLLLVIVSGMDILKKKTSLVCAMFFSFKLLVLYGFAAYALVVVHHSPLLDFASYVVTHHNVAFLG